MIDIFDALKQQKRKYGTSYELASLGAIVSLDLSINDIVNEIIEVDDFLKEQKEFGAFGIGNTQRLMYAALLVMDTYMPDSKTMQNSVMGSTLSMVIAQQTAMLTIMAAMMAGSVSQNT